MEYLTRFAEFSDDRDYVRKLYFLKISSRESGQFCVGR